MSRSPRRTREQFERYHEAKPRTRFGEVLQQMRLRRGITLRDMGKRLGWMPSLVWRLEVQTPSPTLRIIGEIAAALGLTLTQFFTELETIESERHEKAA